MLTKKICLILCVLSLTFVFTRCNRFFTSTSSHKKHAIRIPQNYTLAWYPRYIISNDDYSRLFEKKNSQAKVSNIIRRGDILHIIDIEGKDTNDFIWYNVRFITQVPDEVQTEGWVLLRNAIRTYTLNKAKHISRKIIRTQKNTLRMKIQSP